MRLLGKAYCLPASVEPMLFIKPGDIRENFHCIMRGLCEGKCLWAELFRNPILQLSAGTLFDQQTTVDHFSDDQDGGSLGYIQLPLYILAEDVTLLFCNLQDDFFPVRFPRWLHRGGGQLPALSCVVDVRQRDFEGIIRDLEQRLHIAVGVAFVDLQNAGAVGFDQLQAIEHIGEILIAQGGHTQHDVIEGQPTHQTTDGHKLNPVIKDADQGRAAEAVIPVGHGVEQGFTQGFRG